MREEADVLNSDLIDGLRDGCDEAFAELVRLFARDVTLFVCRHVGSRTDADELTQDVFVHAHRSITKYSGDGTLRSWLLGIARHVVLTHLRKKRRRTGTNAEETLVNLQLQQVEDDSFDAEYQLIQMEALRECVASLQNDHRLLIERFYFEGATATSIGEQLGRKPGSVRMLLLRIREALRDCVNSKVGQSD